MKKLERRIAESERAAGGSLHELQVCRERGRAVVQPGLITIQSWCALGRAWSGSRRLVTHNPATR